MTPSSESSGIREALRPSLELNLPVDEGFAPLPPLVSLPEMIQRSRQLRHWFPEGIATPEERWRAKSELPFVL